MALNFSTGDSSHAQFKRHIGLVWRSPPLLTRDVITAVVARKIEAIVAAHQKSRTQSGCQSSPEEMIALTQSSRVPPSRGKVDDFAAHPQILSD
jgi:hypothetical protein